MREIGSDTWCVYYIVQGELGDVLAVLEEQREGLLHVSIEALVVPAGLLYLSNASRGSGYDGLDHCEVFWEEWRGVVGGCEGQKREKMQLRSR